MNNIKRVTILVSTALITIGVVLWLGARSNAVAVSAIPVSGNVSLVPHHDQFTYAVLGPQEARIPASGAIASATRAFGVLDSQVDRRIGAVRALIGWRADRRRQPIRAWIVTADTSLVGPNGILYRKICIVVDATTAQYRFAYAADPVLQVTRH